MVTIAALILWVSSGTYLYSIQCCKQDVPLNELRTLNHYSEVQNSKFSFSKPILFYKGSPTPLFFDEVSTQLADIVTFLKQHPIKILTIFAASEPNEKDQSLSNERARATAELFLSAGVPRYQIKIKTSNEKDLLYNQKYNVFLNALNFSISSMTYSSFKDPVTGFHSSFDDNFVFEFSNFSILNLLDSNYLSHIDNIVSYLNKNKNRKLNINNYYLSNEKNSSLYENVGLSRSFVVRDLFLKAGADPFQIECSSSIENRIAVIESEIHGKILPGSMDYHFLALDQNSKSKKYYELSQSKGYLRQFRVFRFTKAHPTEPYHFSSNEIKYLRHLQNLINYDTISKIYLVGHAFTQKTEDENYQHGSDLAYNLKVRFTQLGFDKNRIELVSAGPSHPLGNSNTDYGKKMNERVDLFVSYNGKAPQLYVVKPKLTTSINAFKEDTLKAFDDTQNTNSKPSIRTDSTANK